MSHSTKPSPRRSQLTSRRRPVHLVLALLALLALLLAGCSTGGGDESGDAGAGSNMATDGTAAGESAGSGGTAAGDDSGEAAAPDADGAGADGERTADEGGGDGTGATAPVVLTAADLGRSIVYTATVEMQADDVAAASREAQLAVTSRGGIVFGQETTSDPQPRSVLVFKVDPADFSDVLDALGGVGEVVSQDVSADDVTERVVDLQSRISSAEVSVQRLRALLADAPSLEAVAALEGQLLERETALEQMRGQLRTLEGQVSLATITVTISQPAAEPRLDVEVTAYVGDDDGQRCPGDEELSVDEGQEAVLCLTIENRGNVDLTEIEVRDHRLGLEPDEVTLVDFADDDVLAPGDEVIAWAPFVADPEERPSPDVSAVPVDDAGTHLRVGLETPVSPVELEVAEDDSLPGFRDAFGASVGALQQLLGVVIVVLGGIVPLLVVLVPLGALVWWWRRRDDEVHDDPTPSPAPTT